MNTPLDFFELDRRFHELDRESNSEETALRAYAQGFSGDSGELRWDDLFERHLVVVLGEPGSGKTREFKERAKQLLASGRTSFFLRLDQLPVQPLSDVLGVEDYQRFQAWRESDENAIFFLDSVDEAKFLKLSDFYVALGRFCDAVGNVNLRRAKILISSRVSEWQPQSDEYELLQRFPQPPPVQKQDQGAETTEEMVAEEQRLFVVQIKPLDRTRVERFASARNVSSVDAFVAALDKAHAWEFARRPLDVIDLLDYWSLHKRLGSLTELMEFTVERKLRESAARDQNDPLSDERAREGAEALSAATVLCRQFNFKVPDDAFAATGSLDPYSCLPEDWQKSECRALLTRPIFDGESYGRIRFHHRRVAEYLAAKWLAGRMHNGCPMSELDELLFAEMEGRRTIRPALAPVAAWLCNDNEFWSVDLHNWVLEAAPTIHLQYGDPSRLSLEYKRRLLRALVRLSDGRKRTGIDSSPDALSRLADPSIAVDISSLIRDVTLSLDLREVMFEVVRYGRLHACLETALEIIASEAEPNVLKSYAVAAIRDVGDEQVRRRLSEIAGRMQCVENDLCGTLCEALYPKVIDARGLIALLRKSEPVHEFSVSLPYYLKSHLEQVLTQGISRELLEQLVELGQTPPHIVLKGERTSVSEQFHWVVQIIPTVLRALLGKRSLTEEESEIASVSLWWLGLPRPHEGINEKPLKEVDQLTRPHPSVRQRYLWRLVEEWRHEHGKDPERLSRLFDYYKVVRPYQGDIEWFVSDIKSRGAQRDRELALRLAIELWGDSGSHWQERRRIRQAVGNDSHLRSLFRQLVANWRWSGIRRLWYWHIRPKLGDHWWWSQRFCELRRRWIWMREQWTFMRNIQVIASGKRIGWLGALTWDADENRTNRVTSTSWEGLRKKRGRVIARAVRQGCKRAWREFQPAYPHEKTNTNIEHGLIVGLAGIHAALTDGELDLAKISDQDAERMVRYAINEINGFAPWLMDLAKYKPAAVNRVLSECIRGEWQFASDREHMHGVIHDLLWRGENLVPLIQDTVLDLLRDGDPPNYEILKGALGMVLKQKHPPTSELLTVVNARLQGLRERRTFILWLHAGLQINATDAMAVLASALKSDPNAEKTMVCLCMLLSGEREPAANIPSPSYLEPKQLRTFIPMVYRYINPQSDIARAGGGAYTPEGRDHAQRFRDNLLVRLSMSESDDAGSVLRELQRQPELAHLSDWIHHLIEERTARRADLTPWSPSDLRSFSREHEIDPKTDDDLFRIACKRLGDIKNDVEKSDNSLREEINPDAQESVLRRWLARKLSERSHLRYTVPQEEEIDRRERPDLRIENSKTDPVSIEIKWADNWTLQELFDGLEVQLVGQYLRAHNSRYGVYVLGMMGRKQSWQTSDGSKLNFGQLLTCLEMRKKELVARLPDVRDVAVIGMDFQNPCGNSF